MNFRLRSLVVFTAALLLTARAGSAPETRILYSLIAPPAAIAVGGAVSLQVVALNRSTENAAVEWPDVLAGELVRAGVRQAITLRAVDAPAASSATLESGRFALRTYRLALPAALPVGDATLEVSVAGAVVTRASVNLVAARSEEPATPGTTQRPPTNMVRAEPAAAALRRAFADRLGAHEPVYFIYGADAPTAKFQFSFKYKLLDFRDLAPQRMMRTVQFAFTQRSLWDIDGESSPFYDTSYMPEIIYEALAPKPENNTGSFTWLGVQGAFKHESNGRDGPLSRSLNIVYARTAFAFGQLDGWHLLAIPEVFTYVSTLEDNPDIEDYRGYGKLHLVLGRNDGPSLMASVWAGKDFNHTTVQIDLTYPIRTRLLNFETYLLVQYFNGYGESLLSYRDQSETLRAGFSLVR